MTSAQGRYLLGYIWAISVIISSGLGCLVRSRFRYVSKSTVSSYVTSLGHRKDRSRSNVLGTTAVATGNKGLRVALRAVNLNMRYDPLRWLFL